jgi:transketolase
LPASAESLQELARRIRRRSVQLAAQAKSSHIGSCLSVADIMAVLYGEVLRIDVNAWADRDRFVISKGHAAAAVYATLAEVGLLTDEDLATFGADGSRLFGHVT